MWGIWLNNPPGETSNGWAGKRSDGASRRGLGFLVLWNGRLDKEILKAQKAGTSRPMRWVRKMPRRRWRRRDGKGFPKGAILFLDQEEGGRLLEEQAAYFFQMDGGGGGERV